MLLTQHSFAAATIFYLFAAYVTDAAIGILVKDQPQFIFSAVQ